MTTHAREVAHEPVLASTPSKWASRLRKPHVYGVAAVMLLTFAAHTLRIVQNWGQAQYRSFDSVIFDQVVHNYSRFQLPYVPLKGVYAGHGPDFLQLGDHFSPIHALLAPLYWIWDDVRMLFFAQAAMYAITAAIVWSFTRRLLGAGPAYLVAISFGVSWGLQSAMDVGYHELDWAVPLLALAVERLYAGKPRPALVAALMLLLVKEELGLLVAVLGVLFFLRRYRRLGVSLAIVGPVWSALAIKVFVPLFGGDSQQYWSYGSLGPGPVEAAKFLVTHPWAVLELAVNTPDKRQLLWWLLVLSLGACLLSPITLLALPSLALRLLSDTPTYTTVFWQYNAPLMAIMLMAGVHGIARFVRRRAETPSAQRSPWFAWAWAGGVLTVAVYCCLTYFPFSNIFNADAWHRSSYQSAVHAVVEQIPENASVEAADGMGPLISGRTKNLLLVDGEIHGSRYAVFGQRPDVGWPYTSEEHILEIKQNYLRNGYEQVWQQDGVWLLRRF